MQKMTTSATTFENQRKADQGDGTYLNPIMAGDHPDPTILKDGDDYYLTFSSFETYPGLIIWHSTDLVNWQPIGPALHRRLGSVFAVDLCKVGDRYFIYMPIQPTDEGEIQGRKVQSWVIYTDDIKSGKWSEPIYLANMDGPIDCGHVIGEDGKRYLFVSGIEYIQLTDDGLATVGAYRHALDPWRYPDDWITEAFAPEGPKMVKRGEYIYVTTAVGGTAGPVTGHMVVVARSKSIHGPWEQHPNNPIVRTVKRSEAWWSRGHATLFEGPTDKWYLIYHGYENDYRSLGRQTLLDPVEWTEDGWPVAVGGDLSEPLPKPYPASVGVHGKPLSDDFSVSRMGTQWYFYKSTNADAERVTFGDGLRLRAKGTDVVSSAPLNCLIGDRDYDMQVSIELEGKVEAGFLLFFDYKLYSGLGYTIADGLATYRNGENLFWWKMDKLSGSHIDIRITRIDHTMSMYYRPHGTTEWTRHSLRFDVQGHDTNVTKELASLRPGLYAAGEGYATFRNFRYQAL